MATKWMIQGTSFIPTSDEELCLIDALPPKTYMLDFDKRKGLYLTPIKPFEIPKLYGDVDAKADRILNTFQIRPGSTGVLLSGEKGSGKTLLAKVICDHALGEKIPVIVVPFAACGPDFNAFVQSITQPCIFLLDEFEKTYDREQQEQLLTLLDGVFPSKKMFILTCNDLSRVNNLMTNRPGRLFYALDFYGLEEDFIREYCEDVLWKKEHIPGILAISKTFDEFSFDMLQSLVEEMNRYDEDAFTAIKMLNAKPLTYGQTRYKMVLTVHGEDAEVNDSHHDNPTRFNPLNSPVFEIEYRLEEGEEEEEGSPRSSDPLRKSIASLRRGEWVEASFTQAHLKHVDSVSGTYVFNDGQGLELTLTKVPVTRVGFDHIRNYALAYR